MGEVSTGESLAGARCFRTDNSFLANQIRISACLICIEMFYSTHVISSRTGKQFTRLSCAVSALVVGSMSSVTMVPKTMVAETMGKRCQFMPLKALAFRMVRTGRRSLKASYAWF